MTNAEKFKEVFGVEPVHPVSVRGDYICPPKGCDRHGDGKGCSKCLIWWKSEYKETK